MPKKLVSLLALLLAVTMILCACGRDTQNDEETTSRTEPTTLPTSAPTDPVDPSEPTDPTDEVPDESSEQPEDDPEMNPLKALYGASGPDGYGIWREYMGLSTLKTYCVDTKGYVTFEADKSETDATGVYNQAVIMKVNYDYYILRSVIDGKLLFDSSNSDGAKILLPEHAGKAMFRDGYIMVMKANEANDGVTYEIGFMNPQGEWIMELTADNPLLKHLNSSITMDVLERDIVYMGEGILGMRCSDKVYRYYDINKNSIVKVGAVGGISDYTLFEKLEYSVFFKDGVSDPVYMNNNFYLFYPNGKIEAYKVLWPKGYPRATRLGNPYFDRQTKKAYFLYEYDNSIMVVNNDGKILNTHKNVDVKEFNYLDCNRTACRGFAEDGYARIIIENSEGVFCYAVLGIDGKFLFDPVQLDSSVNTVFDPDGYHIDVKSTAGYGYFVVIDNDGKIRYQSDYVNDFKVKNGVACFNNDGKDVYIDVRT